MIVTVITNPELGWDCVVDVIKGTEEEAKKAYIEEAREDFNYGLEKGWSHGEFNEEDALESYCFFEHSV